MNRPPSIVRYERLYWVSIVLSLINNALTFAPRVRLIDNEGATAGMGEPLVLGSAAIGLAISVVLWWFTARRGAVVAKWVVVILAVFAALSILLAVPGLFKVVLPVYTVLVGMAANALYIAAALFLFRPDAKLWFGEDPDDQQPEDIA